MRRTISIMDVSRVLVGPLKDQWATVTEIQTAVAACPDTVSKVWIHRERTDFVLYILNSKGYADMSQGVRDGRKMRVFKATPKLEEWFTEAQEAHH